MSCLEINRPPTHKNVLIVFAIIAQNEIDDITVFLRILFALANGHHDMCNEMIGFGQWCHL